MGLLLDDKSVIHIPEPMPRGFGSRPESFSLKMFYVQNLQTMGLTGDPIATSSTCA